MRRIAPVIMLGLVLLLAACDTEPATNVSYFSATLNGKGKCYGSEMQHYRFAYRKVGAASWTAGPWHSFQCSGETTEVALPVGSPGETITGLDDGTNYQYRLETDVPNGLHWYDSAGTDGGTNYEPFTTLTFPRATPKSAFAFRDSIGVNVKSAYIDTPFGDYDNVKDALVDMGIRHIRDGIWWPTTNPGAIAQKPFFRDLNDLGIKGTLGFGCIYDYDKINDVLNHWADPNADGSQADSLVPFVAAWENPNEVNFDHGGPCPQTNWESVTRTYAETWFNHLHIRGFDNGRPIIGPSCGGSPCEGSLGDLSNWVDGGNIHPYRGPDPPETAVEDKCDDGTTYVPDGDCYITEFGWAISQWAGTERVQANYTLRAFLDYFSKDVPRSYVHQLVDLGDDLWYVQHCNPNWTPNECLLWAGREGSFGLYNENWDPNEVVPAIKNLTTTVGDGTPTLTQLKIKYEQEPASLRKVLLRQADGDYVLALWRLGASPGNASVTIWLPDATQVTSLRPLDSSTQSPVTITNGRVNVTANGEPLLLTIR
jgi:hypothetical protein